MNELKLFSNPEFGKVRMVEIKGKPYFVGKDIACALGYSDTAQAIRNHCKGVVEMTTPTNGGEQTLKVITEGDVYRLIVRSKLPTAERFEKWVMDEVLPSLRETGTYSVAEKLDSYMIENPVERAQRWIEEQKEKMQLEEKVTELTPKADYFDKLVDSNLLTNFRDTAKQLGYSQTEFTGWLLQHGYVYKDSKGIIKPYEPHRKSGLFVMKDFTNPHNGFSGVRTYVTVRGKETFRLLMQIP